MEIKVNLTAEQAQALLQAAYGIVKTTPEQAEADAFQLLMDAIDDAQRAGQAEALWVTDVQVAVLSMAGVGVEDEQTARGILADLFGLVGPYEQPMQAEGCGVWLVSVPQHVWDELEAEGGTLLTHSAGYVVEIPMA